MVLRILLSAAFLLSAAPAQAGAAPETASAPELPDLGEPAAAPAGAPPTVALVTRQLLQQHAYWLADDARRGRYTGSTAQQETAEYVAAQFERLGLAPDGDKGGWFQWYPIEQLVLHDSTGITVDDVDITDVAVLPATGTKRVSASGRLVWCGGGRGDELPGTLKGRIPVVVLTAPPRGSGPSADLGAIQIYTGVARQLARLDAKVGVVVLPGDPGSYGNTLNYRGLLPDHPLQSVGGDGRGVDLSIPLIVVAGGPAMPLLRAVGATIADNGAVTGPTEEPKATAKVRIRIDTVKKGKASNVVGVLQGGSRKQEALVISAHHDHIGRRIDGDAFNGADDNASGTAGLLALAEALAKGGEPPARSIVFLSVSGEELGLWGSAWYADHPSWPLDRIVANVNIDMIGRAVKSGPGCEVQITPSFQHAKYSSLGRLAAQLAPRFDITFTSGDTYYERSDHYNFAQKGVPVVFLCDGEHPDYHQVTDHADKLDYTSMEAIARLLCWTAWEVADGKDRPKELGRQTEW
ncbi:MAG: M28 family metallopeptidase [Planctomycetota bacterium]